MQKLKPNQSKYNDYFLLFENKSGEGDLVKSSKLETFIKRKIPSLDLVFLAACNSEFIGNIFKSCGAKHVVCVKSDRYVLDEAAIAFTKTFYQKLINQTTICQAFEYAKSFVEFRFPKKEADLFTLLHQDDEKEG